MNNTAIIYHERIADYDFGEGHSLRGDRFPRYIQLLKEQKIFERSDVEIIKPKQATYKDIELVHTKEYIENVKKISR